MKKTFCRINHDGKRELFKNEYSTGNRAMPIEFGGRNSYNCQIYHGTIDHMHRAMGCVCGRAQFITHVMLYFSSDNDAVYGITHPLANLWVRTYLHYSSKEMLTSIV